MPTFKECRLDALGLSPCGVSPSQGLCLDFRHCDKVAGCCLVVGIVYRDAVILLDQCLLQGLCNLVIPLGFDDFRFVRIVLDAEGFAIGEDAGELLFLVGKQGLALLDGFSERDNFLHEGGHGEQVLDFGGRECGSSHARVSPMLGGEADLTCACGVAGISPCQHSLL